MTIVLSTGLADGGRRAAIAFGVALAALAREDTVHLFLSLEAAVIGAPTGCTGVHPRGFSDSLETCVQHFLDLGGRLEVCSSCYEEYCHDMPKGDDGKPTLGPNTTIQGLGVLAARAHQMPIVAF